MEKILFSPFSPHNIDYADCITHLLAAKADTRKSTPTKKMTALLIATAANNVETVKRMAQGGLDLDYCGKDGQTALMLAAEVCVWVWV